MPATVSLEEFPVLVFPLVREPLQGPFHAASARPVGHEAFYGDVRGSLLEHVIAFGAQRCRRLEGPQAYGIQVVPDLGDERAGGIGAGERDRKTERQSGREGGRQRGREGGKERRRAKGASILGDCRCRCGARAVVA